MLIFIRSCCVFSVFFYLFYTLVLYYVLCTRVSSDTGLIYTIQEFGFTCNDQLHVYTWDCFLTINCVCRNVHIYIHSCVFFIINGNDYYWNIQSRIVLINNTYSIIWARQCNIWISENYKNNVWSHFVKCPMKKGLLTILTFSLRFFLRWICMMYPIILITGFFLNTITWNTSREI